MGRKRKLIKPEKDIMEQEKRKLMQSKKIVECAVWVIINTECHVSRMHGNHDGYYFLTLFEGSIEKALSVIKQLERLFVLDLSEYAGKTSSDCWRNVTVADIIYDICDRVVVSFKFDIAHV